MTLPASPNAISMYEVAVELGATHVEIDLNQSDVRTLAERTTDKSTISMSFFHGKANMPAQTYYLYSDPGTYWLTNPTGPHGIQGRLVGGEGGGGGGGGAGEWNWNAGAAGASGGSGGMGQERWFSTSIETGDQLEIVVGGGGAGGQGGAGTWTGLGTSGGYYRGDLGYDGNAGGPSYIRFHRGAQGMVREYLALGGSGGKAGYGGINDSYTTMVGGNGGDGYPGGFLGAGNSGKLPGARTSARLIESPVYRQGNGTGGPGGWWGDETLTKNQGWANNMDVEPHYTRIRGQRGGDGVKGWVELTLLKANPGDTNTEQHGFVAGQVYVPSSGGGGGGGGCVAVSALLPDGRTAGEIAVGDTMTLADHETLEEGQGTVTMSRATTQPGFRLETESGAALVCSDTAPIPTRHGFVNPRDLLWMEVPVRHDAEDGSYTVGWERIMHVHSVGDILVQHITVGDRCFWAGETAGSYILHHNLKDDGGGTFDPQ